MGKRMRKIVKILGIFFIFALLMLQACQQKEVVQTASNYEEIAKIAVHNAAVGLGAVMQNLENEADRIALMREFITPIRFYPDSTGYFYIYNYDCVNLAHATQKNLESKNLYDYQDCKGKFVIRELSAAAKNGGGFVEYFWQKPDDTTEYRKLGYVAPIPGTDYFIGTGVYFQ